MPGERIRADHQRDTTGKTGEVERRLPGRVGSTQDVDLVAGHGGSLRGWATVENAGSVHGLDGDAQAPIAGARGQDHAGRCAPL